MPIATLKKVAEKWGISLEDSVIYRVKGNKGIIEVDLKASDKEIELASITDISEDYLCKKEMDYYLGLEDL